MNPYAEHLGSRNPREVLGLTGERLQSLLHKMGTKRAEQPWAPGKWSAREILCHLADCEIAFGFRLRQTLAETDHVIQPFDQNQWANNYGSYTTEAALAVFSSVRTWNLALLAGVSPQALSRKVTHPERGEMTFQVIVESMAGHDLNHLRQIETAAEKSA